MPSGERLGSEVVIWPVSRKGSAGTESSATWLSACDIWWRESETCTVPGAYAGGCSQGTGPSRAQSTLMVAASSRKRCIARTTRAGSSAVGTRSPYNRVASTSATTARPAAIRSLPATSTPTARPRSTTTRVTGASQRISPPRDRTRRASDCVSSPAPPSGTGKPTVWPSMQSSSPITPDPAASSGMSACPALPASSSRGPSPRKRERPSSVAGESRVRTKSRPPTDRSRASRPSPWRTGGKGVSRAPTSWSPARSHSAHRSSQA